MPRREYTPEETETLVEQYTARFRKPAGTMRLKPIQAIALHEIIQCGGLLGPIQVGGGKTLICLLAFTALASRRNLLIMPAALIEKTRLEQAELLRHWDISLSINMISYEALGREAMARELERLSTMGLLVIVADESHKLKNGRAGVTRRVMRHLANHPGTRFIAVSGTLCKGALEDFAEISARALGEGSPLPLDRATVTEWGDCVNEGIQPLRRRPPGALSFLADGAKDLEGVRRGLGSRIAQTRGVVASGMEQVDCSLYVTALRYEVSPVAREHFATLRNLWETPDGWAFSEALTARRHARELALGMHGIWDPRPPDEWLDARRAWAKFVRATLTRREDVDTEKTVRKAVLAGRISDPGSTLATWQAVEDTFTIRPKPIWHDTVALDLCAEWLEREKGVVWTAHTFFAVRLSEMTGRPYYGEGAVSAQGKHVRDAKGPIIASIGSCGTGQNLQQYNKGLVTAPMAGSSMWEQLLGRFHRTGQTADEVTFQVLWGCLEHAQAAHRARNGARMVQDTMGAAQKLCFADVTWPREGGGVGPQWVKQAKGEE